MLTLVGTRHVSHHVLSSFYSFSFSCSLALLTTIIYAFKTFALIRTFHTPYLHIITLFIMSGFDGEDFGEKKRGDDRTPETNITDDSKNSLFNYNQC